MIASRDMGHPVPTANQPNQTDQSDLLCSVFYIRETKMQGGSNLSLGFIFFKYFFIFTPTGGDDPIWQICFKWVDTTN